MNRVTEYLRCLVKQLRKEAQMANDQQKREFIQLPNWMKERAFSALGIQTRPFAAC